MQALSNDPPWIAKAGSFIGFHEQPGNRGIQQFVDMGHVGADGESWCAIFVAACLVSTGYKSSGSAMARSYEHSAAVSRLDAPKRGCIVTFWRGSPASGEGHVTFCTESAAGKIRGLGGNQDDGVCEEWFSTDKVTGYWWPNAGGGASAPAPSGPPPPPSSGDSEFDRLQAGYKNLWLAATIRPEFAAEAKGIADGLKAGQDRFSLAAGAFPGMPWWVPAAINQMESGRPFVGHLFNGDPLRAYTVNVPAGEPKDVGHGPPFSWEESAKSALHHDGLDKVPSWTIPRMLFEAEVHYNGRGYFKREINSPYVWCGTNQYGDPPNVGKFVRDGVFDSGTISKQIGIAAILKSLGVDVVLPDIATPDPTVGHDVFHDLLEKLFGRVKPGVDNIPMIRSRLDKLFGGNWVGGLNKLFPA